MPPNTTDRTYILRPPTTYDTTVRENTLRQTFNAFLEDTGVKTEGTYTPGQMMATLAGAIATVTLATDEHSSVVTVPTSSPTSVTEIKDDRTAYRVIEGGKRNYLARHMLSYHKKGDEASGLTAMLSVASQEMLERPNLTEMFGDPSVRRSALLKGCEWTEGGDTETRGSGTDWRQTMTDNPITASLIGTAITAAACAAAWYGYKSYQGSSLASVN